MYLMRAQIDLPNMARWSAEEHHSDPDRAAHCLMAESFGPRAHPRPFVIKVNSENHAEGILYGYTATEAGELQEAANRMQKLKHAVVLDPGTIQTVKLNEEWEKGQRVGFEVRISPTKRSSEWDEGKGQERAWKTPPGSSAEETYREWLAWTIDRQGVLTALPEQMTVTRIDRRQVRPNRNSGLVQRLDVTITGLATVEAPAAMTETIARGIGRNKSYGYGMMLLRPAA